MQLGTILKIELLLCSYFTSFQVFTWSLNSNIALYGKIEVAIVYIEVAVVYIFNCAKMCKFLNFNTCEKNVSR